MQMIADIRNPETGITFRMRLLLKGDAYGRDNSLTWESDSPGVEFYDSRYPFDTAPDGTMLGQFTGARYYVETLTRPKADTASGLQLDGRVPAWRLSSGAMHTACVILANWTGIVAVAATREPEQVYFRAPGSESA